MKVTTLYPMYLIRKADDLKGWGSPATPRLYWKPADGTAKEELITESELPKMPMSFSPDGKFLVYWVNDPKTRGDIWAVCGWPAA